MIDARTGKFLRDGLRRLYVEKALPRMLVHKEAEVPAALEKIHHLSSLLGEGEALLSFPCSSSECTHWANCRGCLEAISLRGIILAVF